MTCLRDYAGALGGSAGVLSDSAGVVWAGTLQVL